MTEVVREFMWHQDAVEYAAKKGGHVSPQVDQATGKTVGWLVTLQKHRHPDE